MSAVVEAERLVERMSQPDSVVQGDHFKQHQRATQAVIMHQMLQRGQD